LKCEINLDGPGKRDQTTVDVFSTALQTAVNERAAAPATKNLKEGSMTKKPTGKHAIVIGGSLGGLFTGILLRSMGWYERSDHDLDGRGGGAPTDVVEAFQRGF